jgi:hypothetical protein
MMNPKTQTDGTGGDSIFCTDPDTDTPFFPSETPDQIQTHPAICGCRKYYEALFTAFRKNQRRSFLLGVSLLLLAASTPSTTTGIQVPVVNVATFYALSTLGLTLNIFPLSCLARLPSSSNVRTMQ